MKIEWVYHNALVVVTATAMFMDYAIRSPSVSRSSDG
jgi:hypothetical protein